MRAREWNEFRRRVRVLERELSGVLDPASLRCGVTAAQCRALLAVEILEPAGVMGLASELGLDKSSASRTVDRLSAAKLVTRSPDPQNRRRQRIVLTGRGRRTLASIHHQWNRYYAALLARMPRSGRAAIFEGVTRLAEAVAAHPPRPPGRSPSGNRP